MSVWDWIRQYRAEANKSDDQSRKRLFGLYDATLPLTYKDPDAVLALLKQGRALAEKLGEKWWVAFFDHWLIQTLLYRKHDYPAALDLAIKTVVEVRKADYAQLPQRICIHAELVDIFMGLDPHGYTDAIERAIDYIQSQTTANLECWYCLLRLKVEFAYSMERYTDAESASAHYIAQIDVSGSEHYRAGARLAACELAFRRAAWEELLGLAQEAQQIAFGKLRDSFWLLELSVWEALALRHLKREDEAKRTYQTAMARAACLHSAPSSEYYNALCAYHEAGGDLSAAIALRDQQLRNAIASGSPYYENLAQVKRCELLSQMGTLIEADLEAARATATKLKDPARVLTELERLKPIG